VLRRVPRTRQASPAPVQQRQGRPVTLRVRQAQARPCARPRASAVHAQRSDHFLKSWRRRSETSTVPRPTLRPRDPATPARPRTATTPAVFCPAPATRACCRRLFLSLSFYPHRGRARLVDVRRVGAARPPRTQWTRGRPAHARSAGCVRTRHGGAGTRRGGHGCLSRGPARVVWPPQVNLHRHRSVCTA